MADQPTSTLDEKTTLADDDLLMITDSEVAPLTSKKIKKSNAFTKENVGLDQVDNTSDADKPVSTATQSAIDAVDTKTDNHIADIANPHATTAAQVGLGNVDNTSDIDKPVSTAQAAADTAVQSFSIQRANHTGTQTASTISDFDTQVQSLSSKLEQRIEVEGTTLNPSSSGTYTVLPQMTANFTPVDENNIIKVTFDGSFTGVDKEESINIAVFVGGTIQSSTIRQATVRNGRPQTLSLNNKEITVSAGAQTIEIRWQDNGNDSGATGVSDYRHFVIEEWSI